AYRIADLKRNLEHHKGELQVTVVGAATVKSHIPRRVRSGGHVGRARRVRVLRKHAIDLHLDGADVIKGEVGRHQAGKNRSVDQSLLTEYEVIGRFDLDLAAVAA